METNKEQWVAILKDRLTHLEYFCTESKEENSIIGGNNYVPKTHKDYENLKIFSSEKEALDNAESKLVELASKFQSFVKNQYCILCKTTQRIEHSSSGCFIVMSKNMA